MPLTTCPPPADLERLYLGGLPEKDVEALEQHAISCGSCMAKLKNLLKTNDTLSGVLSDNTVNDATPSSPAVEELIKKLETLRPTSNGSPQAGTPMIAFTCSACPKKLSVKAELAGKKVKCPACGKVTAVPISKSGPVGIEEDRTVPPAVETNKPLTRSPLSGLDATAGVDGGDPDPESSLTDFLSPPQADDELGRLGKYRILKILGHGGMGVVYKAEDPLLKRTVALKAMLPALAASASAGKRFLREAQAMAAVEHDHIVRIYQVDEDRNVPYMAMEFLKGEPLDERLKRDEKMPLTEVLRIGREIAEGLSAAHTNDLIHRDIKPGNIWLEAPRNRVKILDFGLARAASQDSGLTQQGAIIGTPAYMAPEQGRGEAVDGRTDLFSLGVILYRLCSGQQPFRGNDTVSTIMEVALHAPPPPAKLNAEIPTALSDLVMKLLEKDPSKRVATAEEVVQSIRSIEEKLLRKDATEIMPPSPATAPPPRRPKVMVAVAALFAASALAAGIVYFMQTPKGTIRIEIDDPTIEVTLTKTGATVKGVDKHDIKLEPGEHGFKVKRGDLDFETDKFILKKGETITLKVELLPGKVQVTTADGKVIGAKEMKREGLSPPVDNHFLVFDGQASHVRIPGLARLSRSYTVEAWVRVEGNVKETKDGKILSGGGMYLSVLKSNYWAFYAGNKSPAPTQKTSIDPLTRGTWTHLAAVSDGKLRTFFVNGKVQGNRITENFERDADQEFVLGAQGFEQGGSASYFEGALDEVRISRTARYENNFNPSKRFEPDADTLALYHFDEGTGEVLKDSSGNGHHGKIVGAKWARVEESPLVGTPLFNGKDFTGFMKAPRWKIEDGLIKGDNALASLMSQAQYSDMEVSFKIKWDSKGMENSYRGVFTFRADRDPKRRGAVGFSPDGIHASRSSFGLAPKVARYRENDFNDVRVRCKGKQVIIVVNEETLVDGDFDLAPLSQLEWECGKVPVFIKDIRVTDLSKPGTMPPLPTEDAWVKEVAAMSAVKQVEAVKAKLMELNPDFDGNLKSETADGVVMTLGFKPDKVSDLSPLRALTGLKELSCSTGVGAKNFSDLSPLKGLKLNSLSLHGTAVSDLSPLKDMPLTTLVCSFTLVSDLSPLSGVPLTKLFCSGTGVSDLSPLKGMPLTELDLDQTKVSDLSPLKGLPLATLKLSRIKGIDLSPLKDLPLKTLNGGITTMRNYELLRAIKTLETINGKPAADFWKEVDAGAKSPVDDAWVKQVAAMAHKQQVEVVKAKLKELNLDFDGKMIVQDEGGEVRYVAISANGVTDLSPVRAFTGLQKFTCNSNGGVKTRAPLADLTPLKDLKLIELHLSVTSVSDLTPLKNMKLTKLTLIATKVADLSPLHGMPMQSLSFSDTSVSDLSALANMQLTTLNFSGTNVSDLSPLKGMPLTDLSLFGTKVTDLSLLKGMPLTSLNCGHTKVSDLSPLKGMPLTYLICDRTEVSDLSPLKDMPLTSLLCTKTRVSDLSPLRGMPLRTLSCEFRAERDAEILRSIKTLESINNKPAAEFWKGVDAGKPK